MLRILNRFGGDPWQWPVDSSAEFQAGMIAELKPNGNQIVCGVSAGLRPLGIIDDVKMNAFTSNSIDEAHYIPVEQKIKNADNKWVTAYDIIWPLKNPHIMPKSFVATVRCSLNPNNGLMIFPAGTLLNADQDGDGVPDIIYTRVSYTYQIPNQVGDDTTASSNRVTVWLSRLLAQTDQFDTKVTYPLTHPLFVNELGQLTTRQITTSHPAMAIVTAPPTFNSSFLEFLWF